MAFETACGLLFAQKHKTACAILHQGRCSGLLDFPLFRNWRQLGLVRWLQSSLKVSAPRNSLVTRLRTPNKQRHSDRVSISLSAPEASLRSPYRVNQSPGSGIGHDTHPIGAKCGVSRLRAGLRCRLRWKR